MLKFIAAMLFKLLHDRVASVRNPDFIVGADNPHGAYLLRWWLLPRNPIFNVYLHHFLRDDDRALHDHPWFWCSLLLDGNYIEHTIGAGGIHRRQERATGSLKVSSPWRAHRVELLKVRDFVDTQPGNVWPISCWTLFITGPRLRTWGFHCPKGWVPWQQFTAAGNPGEVGAGCD